MGAKRLELALVAALSWHPRREPVVSGSSRAVWLKGAKPKWSCSNEHNPQARFAQGSATAEVGSIGVLEWQVMSVQGVFAGGRECFVQASETLEALLI